MNEGITKVNPSARIEINQYTEKLKNTELDSQKVDYLKSLASIWYAESIPLLSGHYAEQIADIKKDALSWSIAGTTYSIAAQRSTDDQERQYSIGKSRLAFENSLSIDPKDIDNKINLALTYVEAPLEDNPMKGILMLRDLNVANPENVPVIMQLARLSIQTGQYDKAVDRLEKVIELRPNFRDAFCMLAEVMRQKDDMTSAAQYQLKCDNIK